MKFKHYLFLLFVLAVSILISFYPLNYYIMQPGSAYDAGDYISVKNADEDEGDFHFMTVSIGKATPLRYVIAKFREFHEILPVEEVLQSDEDDEEYNVRQMKLMTDAQFNALYVAFKLAGLKVNVSYKGVYVLNVYSNSAASGLLKTGDIITELNGDRIVRQEDLLEKLTDRKLGEVVTLKIKRNDEERTEMIELKEIPNSEGRIGLGISFAESKTIKTDPDVKVNTKDIGGPSAGLMFTLEILNQLLEQDLTKGYAVAGTGEISEEGYAGRIGGVEKKVVAAHKDGMDIFFVPDDEITEAMRNYNPEIVSNYEAAQKTAKKIGTKMKIVPVKTIQDALDYLEALQPKN